MELVTWLPQIVIGVIGLFVTHSLIGLRRSMDFLREADDRMSKRITDLEVSVASKYITRAEISESQKDLRADIRTLRNELINEFKGINAHLTQLDREKVDR